VTGWPDAPVELADCPNEPVSVVPDSLLARLRALSASGPDEGQDVKEVA
jgi:hypothetical protein